MASNALPSVLQRLVERTVPPSVRSATRLRLFQRGEMMREPGGRAMPWTGVEEFDLRQVAFSWKARFPVNRLAWIVIEDAYEQGTGYFEGRLWGRIRLFRQTGADFEVGEVMRYLAELAWAPPAILANKEISWQVLEDGQVEAATEVGGKRVAVQMWLNDAGDIVEVYAPERPRAEGEQTVPRPWGGTFTGHKDLGGLWVPAQSEVYWELPEGRFVYWRGEVTGLELA